MLELYQFELSHYSEKVRFLLDFKGLDYRKVEVTPGIGQMEVFQLSGQSAVPVLKDGETVVADSTEIARYLERQYPEPAAIPSAPRERGLCWLMEEWADESIGLKGRRALIGALNQNQNLRASLLPDQTPDAFKTLVSAVPPELLDVLGAGVGVGGDALKEAQSGIEQDLEALSLLLEAQPYLVAETPTLADFAVAGLSAVIKFPSQAYLELPADLADRGIPGLADNPAYARFFEWRDRLYHDYRRPRVPSTPGTGGSANGDSPTSIAIE